MLLTDKTTTSDGEKVHSPVSVVSSSDIIIDSSIHPSPQEEEESPASKVVVSEDNEKNIAGRSAMVHEPTTVREIIEIVANHNNNTGNDHPRNLREALRTIRETDGSHKRGDILVKNPQVALIKLKQMMQAHCLPLPKRCKSRIKWEFRASPHAYVGSNLTIDDMLMAFLTWGQRRGGTKSYNISKAFRRLDSYAEWLQEAHDEIMYEPLTYESVKQAIQDWGFKISINQDGVLIWYTDLAKMNVRAIRSNCLHCFRAIVWVAHFVMYQPAAAQQQEQGIQFCENLNRMSFVTALSLLPNALKHKIDKLTMGCLPVRITKIILLDCPFWVELWMRFVFVFLSQKIKSRFNCQETFASIDQTMGTHCIPQGFGNCNGTLARDLIEESFDDSNKAFERNESNETSFSSTASSSETDLSDNGSDTTTNVQ